MSWNFNKPSLFFLYFSCASLSRNTSESIKAPYMHVHVHVHSHHNAQLQCQTNMKLFDSICLIVQKCFCSFDGFLAFFSLILCLLHINLHTLSLYVPSNQHMITLTTIAWTHFFFFLSQLSGLKLLQPLPLLKDHLLSSLFSRLDSSWHTALTSIVFSQCFTIALDRSWRSFLSLTGCGELWAPVAAVRRRSHSSLLITVACNKKRRY